MNTPLEPGNSLWAGVKRILDTVLATAQNRVELFAVELQEEKCRLVEAVLLAAAVTACGMMALTLVTFTIIILVWQDARIPALVILSVLYLAGALISWRALQKRLKNRTAFSGSLGEIKKDRSCLQPQN